ncbi:MAG: hypothetical protein KDA87_13440 [Planctomycetales bacterium]|nr:hypothetical protein [Planctomycetales bacterium]
MDLEQEYQQLHNASVTVALPNRTLIQFTGNDRQSFVNNLCTNNIKPLTANQGCEAFVTNVQGKTIGHGFFFCETDQLLLSTVPQQANVLLPHFDKYLISEDVNLSDLSTARCQQLVAGPAATHQLGQLIGEPLPSNPYSHLRPAVRAELHIALVPLLNVDCFLVTGSPADVAWLVDQLTQAGTAAISDECLQLARIEHGFPWFGIDFDESNLPQELDRNDLAISFVKGCYLGQETVARLDALGHVNKQLTGVAWDQPDLPAVGSELRQAGATVGKVTSVARSVRTASPLGLAIVRCSAIESDEPLESDAGSCRVVSVPVTE